MSTGNKALDPAPPPSSSEMTAEEAAAKPAGFIQVSKEDLMGQDHGTPPPRQNTGGTQDGGGVDTLDAQMRFERFIGEIGSSSACLDTKPLP